MDEQWMSNLSRAWPDSYRSVKFKSLFACELSNTHEISFTDQLYKRACVTFIFWKLLIHAAQPKKYMLAYASRHIWRDAHAHIASYSVNIHSCCFVFTHIYMPQMFVIMEQWFRHVTIA